MKCNKTREVFDKIKNYYQNIGTVENVIWVTNFNPYCISELFLHFGKFMQPALR